MAKETKEQIMEKLKKLMTHYQGALDIGSEEEANTAAALLQKMMMRYQVTKEELEGTMTEKQREEQMVEEYLSTYTKKSIGGDWEYMLMNVICKYNLCRAFWNGPKKRRMMVILGRKDNVEFCKYLHSMLMEKFVAISKTKYKEFKKTDEWEYDPINIDTYQRRFLLGCADGLERKFIYEKHADEKNDNQFALAVQGIVKRESEAISNYISNNWGSVGVAKSGPNIRQGSAYHEGVTTGRNASTNRPIASQKASNTKLLS